MANQQIFCNAPWTNVHIYHDGSFGACCAEGGRIYDNSLRSKYNIENYTIQDWYNLDPAKEFRKKILGDSKLAQCHKCYHDELNGFISKRNQENQKTIIFHDTKNFDRNFIQSTGYRAFKYSQDNAGLTDVTPVDWHIDLGNECNLACKMCDSTDSSKIGSFYKKWGLLDKNKIISTDWTKNTNSWNNFIKSLDQQKNLNRLHFMGGETTLSKRFHYIIDKLILEKRNELVSLSFVTNGMFINSVLLEKLKKFKSCDIEISIEAFDRTNDYIRQGSNIEKLKSIIDLVLQHQTDQLKLVLRSVPQLLNVNSYDKYLKWAVDNSVAITSIPLKTPKYLRIEVLPKDIKEKLKFKFLRLKEELEQKYQFNSIVNARDVNRIHLLAVKETEGIISSLDSGDPDDVEIQRFELTSWLSKWDKIYGFNALEYYPEYSEFLIKYGYEI